MNLKNYISLIFLLVCSLGFCQNENNIWYFGENAGLDFSSSSPVALTNGQMDMLEGCASVSSPSGKLLFYTDGMTVWNKNHTVMVNGTGLFGENSSTQSAIIVKKPGSSSLYYVFTTPAHIGFSNGFNYSEVDIELDSGLGAVTVNKNIFLATKIGEKITVIKHANGTDFWVITRSAFTSAKFYSFHLSCDGLDMVPVISNVGIAGFGVAYGYLKGSPNGERIASVNGGDVDNVEVFDFDDVTGLLSNPIKLDFTSYSPYGVEFSPDNNLLYVSSNQKPCNIYQYNLQVGSELAINNSKVLVGIITGYEGGALQLGPDNKIYHARPFDDHLGVISQPNTIGLGCNYNSNGVSLSGKRSLFGLPSLTYNNDLEIDLGNDTSICNGETIFLNAQTFGGTYNWQDGSTNSSYTINQEGTYSVTLSLNACVAKDTVIVTEENCFMNIELPNIFTPNNDGLNDLFTPITIDGVTITRTVIYNRWGRKVFETDNPLIKWGGEKESDGSYFWVVNYSDESGMVKTLNGYLALIR